MGNSNENLKECKKAYRYKLIAKNDRTIKEKVKINSISGDSTIIQTDNLIQILKDTLPTVYLSPTQWRMIVSFGDVYKFGLVDYNNLIKFIKLSSKISNSHTKK